MGNVGKWILGVIFFILILPVLPLIALDFARIMWASVPWWAQVTFAAIAIILIAGGVNKVLKKFRGKGTGGRTEIHHYYH